MIQRQREIRRHAWAQDEGIPRSFRSGRLNALMDWSADGSSVRPSLGPAARCESSIIATLRHVAGTRGGFDALVADIERGLRAEGWAEHTSVSHELQMWARLGQTVGTYSMTVDDYTNDLCSRDYLDLALVRLPAEARARLTGLVAPLDEAFRSDTVADDCGLLWRFFRVGVDAGWWWFRIPRGGPLAEYLSASAGD